MGWRLPRNCGCGLVWTRLGSAQETQGTNCRGPAHLPVTVCELAGFQLAIYFIASNWMSFPVWRELFPIEQTPKGYFICSVNLWCLSTS